MIKKEEIARGHKKLQKKSIQKEHLTVDLKIKVQKLHSNYIIGVFKCFECEPQYDISHINLVTIYTYTCHKQKYQKNLSLRSSNVTYFLLNFSFY